jgi:2,4-dienoyl-CoA reductase-like NADH-dependent reductase (Old Yellow Enzyme family)
MELLFQPFSLRNLTLPNRIVVSPMAQYSAQQDGKATDWHLMHYGSFAASGAGLTILEATAVLPEGRVSPNCLGLWDDAQIPGLKRIVDFFRRPAGGMVGIQLAHAGRKASVPPPWQGTEPLAAEAGGWQLWGASDCPYPGRDAPIAPNAEQLEAIAAAYVAAIRRADAAGFDLVELHCAHGYFLNNFLSPLSNTRTDQWGGDLEGRMRFPLDVFRRVRAAWPAHKPLGVRVSAVEWVEGGWNLDDSVVFAQRLKALGCDYVALSSGGTSPDQKITVGPGYQVSFSEEVRRRADLPTIAVGMLSDPQLANDVLKQGRADLIAIGRGMLFNPRWAWHAAAELQGSMRVPEPYLRCHPSMRNLPR